MSDVVYPIDHATRPTIGIDVSKRSLDIAGLGRTTFTTTNTPAGCRQLARKLARHRPRVVAIEATGGYEQLLLEALWDLNVPVALLQPSRVRHHAKADGQLAKTDRIDARVIADFARTKKVHLAQRPAPQQQALRLLLDRRTQIVQDRVREMNRLEAVRDKPMRREITRHIKHLAKLEADLDRRIAELIESDEILRTKSRFLQRARGVGPVVATTLLCRLPELGSVNRQRVASLVGLAPYNRDSGTLRGKRSIYAGRGDVRRVLYLGVVSAIRHAGPLRDRYRAMLAQGKPKKVALTACARILLVSLNARMAGHLAENRPAPAVGA